MVLKELTHSPTVSTSLDRYYDELLSAGVLVPLTSHVEGMRTSEEGTTHYVTPKGTSSIVKHFIKEANLTPK